jgi:hypothetical protein
VVHPDYTAEDGEFLSSPEPASAEQLEKRFPLHSSKKAALLHYAAERLDAYENAGLRINVGTDAAPKVVRMCSDIACYSRVTLAWNFLQASPDRNVTLITGYGFREVLSKPEVEILKKACEAHTGSVYAAHADAIVGIKNGSITTEAQVDALAWPHLPSLGRGNPET